MTELKKAKVFDADGTLWNVDGIRHLVRPPEQNFHAFHMASVNCPPNPEVAEEARKAAAEGCEVIVLTARTERYRAVTSFWLALHDVPCDRLLMRRNGDGRPDAVIKREIIRWLKRHREIIHAWDDNPAVIGVWKDENVPFTVVPGWDRQFRKGEQ